MPPPAWLPYTSTVDHWPTALGLDELIDASWVLVDEVVLCDAGGHALGGDEGAGGGTGGDAGGRVGVGARGGTGGNVGVGGCPLL